MICPNGCTDDFDGPLEMEFTQSPLHNYKPGHQCEECGYFERQCGAAQL